VKSILLGWRFKRSAMIKTRARDPPAIWRRRVRGQLWDV